MHTLPWWAVTAVAVLATAAAAAIYTRHRTRTLRRALRAERCTSRLTAGVHARDLDAFRRRLAAAVAAHPSTPDALALDEAERIVDRALAHHQHGSDPKDGGTP